MNTLIDVIEKLFDYKYCSCYAYHNFFYLLSYYELIMKKENKMILTFEREKVNNKLNNKLNAYDYDRQLHHSNWIIQK